MQILKANKNININSYLLPKPKRLIFCLHSINQQIVELLIWGWGRNRAWRNRRCWRRSSFLSCGNTSWKNSRERITVEKILSSRCPLFFSFGSPDLVFLLLFSIFVSSCCGGDVIVLFQNSLAGSQGGEANIGMHGLYRFSPLDLARETT